MSIRFDEGAADRLIFVCDRISCALRDQGMQRDADRQMVMEDFNGPYATLFSGACVVESEDRARLAGKIGDLGVQIRRVKCEAQREKQREADLVRWQENEAKRECDSTGFFQDIGDSVSSFFDPKPSMEPVVPTPILAVSQVRVRQRVSRGGSSQKTSADPDRLRSFAAGSRTGNNSLQSAVPEFKSAWSTFVAQCSWAQVESMTCVSAFEQLFAENIADQIWANRLADLFELAGGGAMSNATLDLVGTTASWEQRLSLWAGEFARYHPELAQLLGDQLNDEDFLKVLHNYHQAFDDKNLKAESVLAMLDEVSAFAKKHFVLHQLLDGFLTSDTSGGLQAMHRLEIAQIFARANIKDTSMILSNLDDVKIVSTSAGGVFNSPGGGKLGGEITFLLGDSDERGTHFVLIHEMAHAADYNCGVKTSGVGWITGSFKNSNGLRLDQVATNDFINDARKRLEEIAAKRHKTMNQAGRSALVDETMNHLTNRPSLTADEFEKAGQREEGAHGVSENSALLYRRLNREYTDLFDGPYTSAPSDVFAGITNFKVSGNYGHDSDYWFKGENQVRSVEKELFSETMAWRIIAEQDGDKAVIKATGRFMPESARMVDQIVNEKGQR